MANGDFGGPRDVGPAFTTALIPSKNTHCAVCKSAAAKFKGVVAVVVVAVAGVLGGEEIVTKVSTLFPPGAKDFFWEKSGPIAGCCKRRDDERQTMGAVRGLQGKRGERQAQAGLETRKGRDKEQSRQKEVVELKKV